DLASAAFSFFSTALRAGRELSGCDCGNKKSEEGNPVVSCGNGERAERWQEEEVETEHREDRREQRRQAAPASSDEKDIQQQRERNDTQRSYGITGPFVVQSRPSHTGIVRSFRKTK